MAIAGVVVTAVDDDQTPELARRLDAIPAVEVQGIGPGGVALVIEAARPRLQEMAKTIESWKEVGSFSLAYVNWEDEKPTGTGDGADAAPPSSF